ncbi:hypothetical protein ACFLT7_05175 [candidate division KSB1 bacterium]
MQQETPTAGSVKAVWSAIFHLTESLTQFRTRSLESLDRQSQTLSATTMFSLQFYDHLINGYIREKLRNLDIPVDVAYRRYMKNQEISLIRLLRRIKPKSRREYRKFLETLDEQAEAINRAFIRSQTVPLDIPYFEEPNYKSLGEKQVYQILSFEEQILDLIHPLSRFEEQLWTLLVNRKVCDKLIDDLRDSMEKIPEENQYFVVYGLSNLRDLSLDFEEKEEYFKDVFDLRLDSKIRKSHEYYLRAIEDFHIFLENLETLSTNKFYVAKKSYEIAVDYRNQVLDAVKRLLSPLTKLANDPDALRQTGITRLKQSNLLFPGGDPLKILPNDPLLKDVGCNLEHVNQEVEYLRRNPDGKRQLSNIKIRLAVDCLDSLSAQVETHNREARAVYMEKVVLANLRALGFNNDDGRSIYRRAIREGISEIAFNILVIQIRDNGDRNKVQALLQAAFLLEEQGRLLQVIKADDRTRKMFNLYGSQEPKEQAAAYALTYSETHKIINRTFIDELTDGYDIETSAISGQISPPKLLLERAMRDYINVAGLQFSRTTYEDTLAILELSASNPGRLNSPALRQEGFLYRLIPRISAEVFAWALARYQPHFNGKELTGFLQKELKQETTIEKIKNELDKLNPLWDASARTDAKTLGPVAIDDSLEKRLKANAGFGYLGELKKVAGIIDRFKNFGAGMVYHQAMIEAKTLAPVLRQAQKLPAAGKDENIRELLEETAVRIDRLADPLEEV